MSNAEMLQGKVDTLRDEIYDFVLNMYRSGGINEAPVKLRFIAAAYGKRIRRLVNQNVAAFIRGDSRLYVHLDTNTGGHFVVPRSSIDEYLKIRQDMDGESYDETTAMQYVLRFLFGD